MRSIENDIYTWGENKVFFQDLNTMIENIKYYKKDKNKNSFLGDWSSCLNKIEPFRDNKGGKRIGIYMQWLQKELSKGLKKNIAIKNANLKYVENWGQDKVYLLK